MLEALFELAASEDTEVSDPLPDNTQEILQTTLSNLDKIENSLPQVKGLEEADSELDELAKLATTSFKDLQDLGMQVEARFSSEIFSAAGTMLGHAIAAKTAKVQKKLKMIELQLKKAALDQKTASQSKEIEATPIGQGKVLDRNELLKILNAKKEDK